MVNWNVTIGGNTITNIFDIDYDSGGSEKLGQATVICANNTNNRSVSSGEEVTIKKNGTVDFTGYVTGKPTQGGAKSVELEIDCKDKRSELKYQQVNRVFYQKNTGKIIREAINNELEAYATDNEEKGNYIHKGNSTSNWSTDIPKFDVGGIASVNLENVGSDFLFLGWPEGSGRDNDNFYARYTNVPARAIPGDGKVDTFFTRLHINDSGEQFSIEVDLRDNSGNNYIWPIKLRSNRFETMELKAEDAVTTANVGSKLTTDGALEYRFRIDGTLPESRASAIDFSSAIPFGTNSRSTNISTSGVEDTNNIITRRMDQSIFEMLREFAVEDGYVSYIDENDVLHYEPGGQQTANLQIDYNSTPVTDAGFDRDYENITNKVTVQGDGDIRVTLEDSASIDFYGISARQEPLVDKEIQTRDEAIKRGRGFLKRNAWDDSAFTFEIADASYQSLQIGDDIIVNWPPENINGDYAVSNIETDQHGIVTVELTSANAV